MSITFISHKVLSIAMLEANGSQCIVKGNDKTIACQHRNVLCSILRMSLTMKGMLLNDDVVMMGLLYHEVSIVWG